jgi:hypothetical protein
MAIMAAQGRSLGFSLVFATQDIPAMLRENDKEAKSIIANTSTKIFMRVEETEMTGKLAVDSAGEGYKAHVGGFTGKAGEVQTAYHDNMEARVERVTRINPVDLKGLDVGQAFVTWHDKYFKIKTFHAYPEGEYGELKDLELRANHFIPVQRPNPVDVVKQNLLPEIAERLCDPGHAKRMEEAARKARAQVEKLAAEKRDPLKIPGEIPCGAVSYLRSRGRSINSKLNNAALQADLMTAACSSIAAVLLASKEQGETFSNAVRTVEGMPTKSGVVVRDGRSGETQAPSQTMGLVRIDSELPPMVRDPVMLRYPDARTGPDACSTPSSPVLLDIVNAQGEVARSDAPSIMRAVEHGITVDTDVFKMAKKIQTNDSTLRMLASLDFEDEPSEEVVNNAIEVEISLGDDDAPPATRGPPPATARSPARSNARTWPRPRPRNGPTAPASRRRAPPPRNDAQLEDAVRSGDANAVTSVFLADLLSED